MLLCIFKFCLLLLLSSALDLHAWDIIREKHDFLSDKIHTDIVFCIVDLKQRLQDVFNPIKICLRSATIIYIYNDLYS